MSTFSKIRKCLFIIFWEKVKQCTSVEVPKLHVPKNIFKVKKKKNLRYKHGSLKSGRHGDYKNNG